MAAAEVDDVEPRVAQPHGVSEEHAGIVRPAVLEHVHHLPKHLGDDRRAAKVEDSRDSAHEWI